MALLGSGRVRQSVAPGVWVDRGPASAIPVQRRYAVVPVLAVGSMVPLTSADPHPVTNSENRRRAERNQRRADRIAAELEPQDRPRCGVLLPVIGEPCGRRPGHKYEHHSAAYVSHWNVERNRRNAEKRAAK